MTDSVGKDSDRLESTANDGDSRPTISLFFPVYNDGHAIAGLTESAVRILAEVTSRFEIVIINDGSTDDSGKVADQLSQTYPSVRVIHHGVNRGYGEALRTGFAEVSGCEWICFTDGDHQYDIGEIRDFAKLLPHYGMLLGFRARKTYGPFRRVLSWGLNKLVRLAFGTRFRDVTCGFKMVRSEVMAGMPLVSRNAFAGGEVAIRAAYKGYPVGEVSISMYPRQVGSSSIVSLRSIAITLADILKVRRDLFLNHPRKSTRTSP